MCGIAGYFGTGSIAQHQLDSCLKEMRRRGPDHAAYRQWTTPAGNNVYLLHARLNIIDLDARANQPLRLGNKWIAYNGELYNYLEVRADLAASGHTFSTASDTEVLLRALDHYGWQGLDRCEGMWAMAVYDAAAGSLTLCRDRFGEKPLYLYQDASGLYFGSEVKFIMSLLGQRLQVNLEQLYRYLVNGYKALYKSGDTFFHGVAELPPASCLHLDAAGEMRHSATGACSMTLTTPCHMTMPWPKRGRASCRRSRSVCGPMRHSPSA